MIRKQSILSFAGSWKDIDQELFTDLTENLHQKRIDESKFSTELNIN